MTAAGIAPHTYHVYMQVSHGCTLQARQPCRPQPGSSGHCSASHSIPPLLPLLLAQPTKPQARARSALTRCTAALNERRILLVHSSCNLAAAHVPPDWTDGIISQADSQHLLQRCIALVMSSNIGWRMLRPEPDYHWVLETPLVHRGRLGFNTVPMNSAAIACHSASVPFRPNDTPKESALVSITLLTQVVMPHSDKPLDDIPATQSHEDLPQASIIGPSLPFNQRHDHGTCHQPLSEGREAPHRSILPPHAHQQAPCTRGTRAIAARLEVAVCTPHSSR
jgi:hypothetical protein